MEEFWDSSEVPSKLDETFHRCFQSLVIRGLLPNEAADLALKVATGTVARPIDPSDLMKEFELAKGSARVESLVIKIKSIFSSLDELSISFLPEKGSVAAVAGVDMALLEKFYSSAKELESKDVDAAIMESIERLLSLDKGCWALGNSIVLRNIITLLENRFFSCSVYYGTLQKLWKLILGQPANVKANLLLALQSSSFSFCNYPFVYETTSKSKILQWESNIQMRNEFQDALLRSLLLERTCPYLVLRVRRENLIRETILQIQFQGEDLKKPLKVQFIGEEGIDEGGVQKEFFQLLVRDIFDSKYGMFSYNEDTRLFWFNSPPWDAFVEFELVGILLGLAIYNGHILELHFPRVVYKKLLGKVPTMEDLAEVNPGLAKGLQQLLQFDGDVEEVFCRSFQVSVQDIFGEFINIELKENGSDISVTRENRKEYVDLCTKLFQPFELEQLICGSPILDFEALEKHTVYEDGYRNDTRVICDFWEIVHSLDEENKRKLLFFVTGSDRAPIKGLANLRFVISKNGSHSDRLPSAHTCFNHLLLPEYENKEKLKDRLLIAINNSQGFGLM